MTEKQKEILYKLVQGNLIVYAVLGFFGFIFPLAQERFNARATAIALQQTRAASTPKANSATPAITPLPPRTFRPFVLTPVLKPAQPILVATAAPIAPGVALAIPSGNNPSNPMTPTDSWQTINSGASVWYKAGSGGDHIDIFLEANPLDGVTMQVYAPGNLERPIGQGTYQKSTGRLVWAGGKWNSTGDWLARVTNGNAGSVRYKLTTTTREIGTCDSISYWEYIGKDLVYWTRCK